MLVAEPDRVGHAQFERSHHRDAAGQPVPGHRGYRVDNTADGTISGYAVNLRTGGLSAEPGSTARTVLHPEAIAVAPDGKNVYVISENDGVLSQFGIDPGTGKDHALVTGYRHAAARRFARPGGHPGRLLIRGAERSGYGQGRAGDGLHPQGFQRWPG